MNWLIRAIFERSPRRAKDEDLLVMLFDHPEMSFEQADWIVNGRKRMLIRLIFLLLALAAAARWQFS